MRWLGAFLHATNLLLKSNDLPASTVQSSSLWQLDSKMGRVLTGDTVDVDPHHQACAIVENLLNHEVDSTPPLGGGDIQNQKRKKLNSTVLTKEKTPGLKSDRVQPTILRNKLKIGAGISERDQLDVLKLLADQDDCFAYTLEEVGQYTGPAMEIKINSQKDIFRPPHKLGEKELIFVGEQCEKLAKLGFIRRSDQSKYASATVVVRKKDEEGNYTDFRKCGDYRPLNLETTLDRYQLPLIETIFNEMKGAKIFSKLDLRSGYHQMPLRECDRAKTAFWGAHRMLWEWCVVPFGLRNAPPYFQKQMDKVLLNLPFARCYIDDIVI